MLDDVENLSDMGTYGRKRTGERIKIKNYNENKNHDEVVNIIDQEFVAKFISLLLNINAQRAGRTENMDFKEPQPYSFTPRKHKN